MARDTNYPEIHRHFLSLMGQYQRANPSVMQGFGSLHPSVMYGLEAFEALGQFEQALG